MAGMRLTGLMSGIDTESIIQQLVEARKTKVDTVKKDQIRLNYKQEAWKSMNKKLKSLQSKIGNMRFSTAYAKMATEVSDDNVVSVITGENAVAGVQSLRVKQLAKTGYLTGKQLESSGDDYTALTKLSELNPSIGSGTITVESASGKADITVNGDTTISDVLTQLKNAGLNANFDAKNQRFFISAKESGEDNDFSITASDANGQAALEAMGLAVNLNSDAATLAQYKEYAAYYVAGDKDATIANMQSLIDSDVASKVSAYLKEYETAQANLKTANEKIAELQAKNLKTVDEYATDITNKEAEIEAQKTAIEGITDETAKKEAEEKLAELEKELETLNTNKADAENLVKQQEAKTAAETKITELEAQINVTATTDADGKTTYTAEATDALKTSVADSYYAKAEYANTVISNYDPNDKTSTGATKVSGQDAIIVLNDAEFKNNTNVFEINGLTFTALNETKDNEQVTITTQKDTEGLYDMIKDFLKDYNEIIKEIDTMYNADSASKYDPLLSEEKAELSETEVEEWEKKIKDSILRRDEDLSSIGNTLKQTMSSGIKVGDKTMYLSNFGIETLSYFLAEDNEKNIYHIDGDSDDENTAGNADKLKSLIASDSETVVSFFTQLSRNLYDSMDKLSSSIDGYRSFGSFYDDKKMKEDYNDYNSKIAELEEKLNDYEDMWYAKFAAMETAMSKMQTNANAVTSLLGG